MAEPKKGDTVVTVGTRKGVFLFVSRDRKSWTSRGPYFEGETVRHAILDPWDGKTIWAGVTSEHFGPIVARTRNLGGSWTTPKEGPRFPKESGITVTRIWQIQPGLDGELWAGVEPAGLFRSDDGATSWSSVAGLNDQPDRKEWPPGNGGLCLHTILPYPGQRKRMMIGISAAGLFGTNDDGVSWRRMNGGIRGFTPDKVLKDGEGGVTCPHKIVRDAKDPAVLYMQNHRGVYRRTRGDPAWTIIEKGLPVVNKKDPSSFGFPIVAHPHDRGTAFIVPMEGDFNRVVHKGAMAVFRTTDGGKRWERLSTGLPQKDAWFTVLRDAMRTDDSDPAGIYVGTTTGQLYYSRDGGDRWQLLADHLQPIQSVEAGTFGGR